MKRTSAFPATERLDGSAVMPVFPASARADIPDFELAEISSGATRPVPMIFRISMLPIEPVPMNPYRVMITGIFLAGELKKRGANSPSIKQSPGLPQTYRSLASGFEPRPGKISAR